MDTLDLPRFLFAFLFVIGLIGLFGYLLKRYGTGSKFMGQKIFSMQDDSGRLKVLIRRDNVEHLLLIADGRELVIESGIEAAMMNAPHASSDHA